MSSISRWYLDAQHSYSFKRYTKFVLYIIIITPVQDMSNISQLTLTGKNHYNVCIKINRFKILRFKLTNKIVYGNHRRYY